MNRAERRKLEKDLGITKHRQQMTMKDRLKNLQQNIQAGRERNTQAEENRRLQENSAADAAQDQEISSLATSIMIKEGLSWYESLESAKREIESRYVKE